MDNMHLALEKFALAQAAAIQVMVSFSIQTALALTMMYQYKHPTLQMSYNVPLPPLETHPSVPLPTSGLMPSSTANSVSPIPDKIGTPEEECSAVDDDSCGGADVVTVARAPEKKDKKNDIDCMTTQDSKEDTAPLSAERDQYMERQKKNRML
ncbi:uncharacterized protein BT62DRAFT_919002 [Guyanagaster necrorhizus]|uniref:Uncharacterized protein n=1 Tax=Guyanagaster necrorhizus TaxID=856835 RepID=A0A9P7VVN7_9AGAR|nr:uncharacterized protein BT62DRAFT_919002 [Guyanagaster necrorhizus MCA 3950]KAG7447789.1 hypothetical protein BT62DRAFT_919002 [Guyanagaster necrorhizus MCA 3950]